MHTTTIPDPRNRSHVFTIHHNGDYSGDVKFQRDTWDRDVSIPFSILLELVTNMVRASAIEKIEQMTPTQIMERFRP